MNLQIGAIDGLIVIGYIVATAALGVILSRRKQTSREFFLAGNDLPTWALLFSIVATETSTVTFLSVPGKAFVPDGDFRFLQLPIGYIIGRLIIVVALLPGYFQGETLTAYQVLERRFGQLTRKVASTIFLLARNAGDGLRLFLTALALQAAIQLDFTVCVLIIAGATCVYSYYGGVRGVVWNDCIQFLVYMTGAAVALALLVSRVSGGWEGIAEFAHQTGRDRVLDFSYSFSQPGVTFWAGLIGGAFLTLATHGVDHLIVQRYLCARSQKAAAWALALSGPIVLLQFALFLVIGVALAAYMTEFRPESLNLAGDQAFAQFIIHDMSVGLTGLILAAIFAAAMSTLSSSLNASAGAMTNDLLSRWTDHMTDDQTLRLARLLTLGFAVVQSGVAIAAYAFLQDRSTIDEVLSVAGFAIGLLLGVYALGMLKMRTPEWAACSALVTGLAVTLYALVQGVNGLWFAFIGATSTFFVGALLSLIAARGKPKIDTATPE